MNAKREYFGEVFWNIFILVSMISLAGIAYAHAAELHGFHKAAFLFNLTIASGWLGIAASTANAAVAQFRDTRKLDVNTLWIVLMIFVMVGGLLMHIDLAQFADSVIETASVSFAGGLVGIVGVFVPNGNSDKSQARVDKAEDEIEAIVDDEIAE